MKERRLLILYITIVAIGMIVVAAIQEDRVGRVERDIALIQQQVSFPCARGRDANCRAFLARLIEAASPRQRRQLEAGEVRVPTFLPDFTDVTPRVVEPLVPVPRLRREVRRNRPDNRGRRPGPAEAGSRTTRGGYRAAPRASRP